MKQKKLRDSDFLIMETCLKATGSKIKELAEDSAYSKMELYIKENGSMICQKVQESFLLTKAIFLRENFSKHSLNLALLKFFTKMAIILREIHMMVEDTDKECTTMPMEISSMEISLMTTELEKGH